MKVNELLRKHRLAKGLTLANIAQNSKKPLCRISAIERGTIRLTVDEFIELSLKGYNLNPTEIVFESVKSQEKFKD